MDPFVKKGIILPRTKAGLSEKLDDYVVYSVDGAIHACAALHIYNSTQAEIAGVAVDESYSKLGIGVKLINYLINKAKAKAKTIEHYLGAGYTVKASMGHLIDLPKSRMAIDVEKSNVPFAQLQQDLSELGGEMGLSIHVQREEIFDAMHTI